MLNKTDEYYMQVALKQAMIAYEAKEVPVGCVIVYKDQIIAKAYNQVETLNDPTAHAEIIAITQAASYLKSWRLADTKIYVTLEPCPMCAGAIQLARIPSLIYGADDPKKGACGSIIDILSDNRFNHTVSVTKGIMQKETSLILKEFFSELRNKTNQ